MNLTISLNGNTQAFSDFNEPIILPENELKPKFNSSVYQLTTLLVSARNGEKITKHKINPCAEIDISELLMPGVIEIEISMLKKGEVVKTWRAQDIFVKDINHSFELTPEIAEMRGALKEIKEILTKNNLL